MRQPPKVSITSIYWPIQLRIMPGMNNNGCLLPFVREGKERESGRVRERERESVLGEVEAAV